MEKILTKRNTIFVVALLSLWKAYLSATLQLHPDEAYYWMWSRHLDFGYFDHAPLIAYVIRLTTLFSQQELWVRFSGILEALVVSVLAWGLSVQLFHDKKIASASVITLNVMPLTLAGSVLITPDIPVFLFVSLSTYWYWQIVATQKPIYWYFLGISFGLSLLSKYTAVLLAPSLLLLMLVTEERRWLKTRHPYAAFLLGCVFFLPVIYWNSQHQWISFVFQMRHGLGGNRYSLGKVMVYIGGQMLVAGPLIWVAGVMAAGRSLIQKNKQTLFLVLTSLPTLLFFAFSAFKKGGAAANWPCCAYFTFSILASHYLISGSKTKRYVWAAAVLFSFVLSFTAGLHARFGVLPLGNISPEAARADATHAFYGWKELAEELKKDPTVKFAVANTHQLAAEVSYYTQERVFAYADHVQISLWNFPERVKDKDGVCIYLDGDGIPACRGNFLSLGKTDTVSVSRGNHQVRTYRIAHGRGYKEKEGKL